MIGSSTRASFAMNATSITADSASSERDAHRRPSVLRRPRQREQQRHDRADQQRKAAPVDRLATGVRLHVRELESKSSRPAMAPTGRLTKKHARHDQWSVSHPPRVGPKIDDDAPERGKQPLVLAALLRREDVADDREQHAGDHAGADALQDRGRRSAVPCRRTAGTPDWPDRPQNADATTNRIDPGHEERLASGSIGQTGEDRQRDRRTQRDRWSRPTGSDRIPHSEATMRGSAVPTIVWSMAASNAASIRPVIVPISCGRVSRTSPEVAYCGSLIGSLLSLQRRGGIGAPKGLRQSDQRVATGRAIATRASPSSAPTRVVR